MSESADQNLPLILDRVSQVIEAASEKLVERRLLFELVILGIITVSYTHLTLPTKA